ncbi:tetratricopeptide repeat protein [Aquitalea magnusonii]|uniref:Glycosyl transferase family 9 (Putative heptosyltransferase) n=1 Tax=Aquitalea magnusonii TaxID=332411 RepID=A0A318K4Z7_9NEIS|nr:tetratricopeptide repeat protein [Aquitalea magnusonii]PXX48768.1 glycosyl transferase family 9 (putative heptosyltransferase) [Aquitalea magnusonii]
MNEQLALNKINQAMQQLQQGKPAVARDGLLRVLKAYPDSAEVNFLLGLALVQLSQGKAALAHFNRAIALQPDLAEAYVNRGILLKNQQQLPQALRDFERAIALRPGMAEAYSNRGNVQVLLDQRAAAHDSFVTALHLDPHNSDAMVNLAALLAENGEYEAAQALLDKVLARFPDDVLARYDLSWLLLLQGDYARGWQYYEARKLDPQLCQRSGLQRFARPEWQGESLEGKTLLLHQEQGLGDTIQMLRYLPLLQQRGARLILLLKPPLQELARQMASGLQVFTRREQLPAFDLHCPMMSLPLRFATTLDNIPAADAYLTVTAEQRQIWAGRLAARQRPRIGLAWSGLAQHLNDRQRSLQLAQLRRLLQLDTEFHSLQREYREETALVTAAGIIDHAAGLNTLEDTAGLITQMDLVISVDTSVAHLAGALGKACWLLLPFNPDFRWGLGRSDSPWYASMQLFRQQAAGEWLPVLDEVARQAARQLAVADGAADSVVAGQHF